MASPAEPILKGLFAKQEHALELPRHHQAVCQPAKRPHRKRVINEILDFDAFRYFAKEMLVVPKTVRPKSLFINEQVRLIYVSDDGHPASGNAKQRP